MPGLPPLFLNLRAAARIIGQQMEGNRAVEPSRV